MGSRKKKRKTVQLVESTAPDSGHKPKSVATCNHAPVDLYEGEQEKPYEGGIKFSAKKTPVRMCRRPYEHPRRNQASELYNFFESIGASEELGYNIRKATGWRSTVEFDRT